MRVLVIIAPGEASVREQSLLPPGRGGYRHVCEFRTETGIRGGRPGALAEQVIARERWPSR